MPALDGRVALVTGGASGLGRATCAALAAAGVHAVAGDIDLPGAEATAAAGGRPDPSVIAPIAARFGLSFDFTEVPDLVARHGLRSPR